MLSMLQDPCEKMHLKVEMATVVDAGKQSVQVTYSLENNGHLFLYCSTGPSRGPFYDQIEASARAIQVHPFPNTDAVIRRLCVHVSQPPHSASQLQVYAKSSIQPGFDYTSKVSSMES